MLTTIYHSHSFSEIGKRTNNEDSIYPKQGEANTNTRLFLVCDGMGGSEGGEIASRVTCEIISEYFLTHVRPNSAISTIEQHIHQALGQVQIELKSIILEKPSTRKMGTTLALLYIHNQGVTIAHIGDSRVYHIQETDFWHTEDHSFVYELYKMGAIDKSEMAIHPKKNMITRVIEGNDETLEPDIKHISKIAKGDYFMLMSDGILEAFNDVALVSLMRDISLTDNEKLEGIKKRCNDFSRDNQSIIMIKIKDISPSYMQIFNWIKELFGSSETTPQYKTLKSCFTEEYFFEKRFFMASKIPRPFLSFLKHLRLG